MIWRNRQTTAIGIIGACIALVPLGAAAQEIPAQTDTLSIEATVAPWAAVNLAEELTLVDDADSSHSTGSATLSVRANFWYDLNANWYTDEPPHDAEFTFINLTSIGAEPGEQEGLLQLSVPLPRSTSGSPIALSGWYETMNVKMSVPSHGVFQVGGVVVTLSTAAGEGG